MEGFLQFKPAALIIAVIELGAGVQAISSLKSRDTVPRLPTERDTTWSALLLKRPFTASSSLTPTRVAGGQPCNVRYHLLHQDECIVSSLL